MSKGSRQSDCRRKWVELENDGIAAKMARRTSRLGLSHPMCVWVLHVFCWQHGTMTPNAMFYTYLKLEMLQLLAFLASFPLHAIRCTNDHIAIPLLHLHRICCGDGGDTNRQQKHTEDFNGRFSMSYERDMRQMFTMIFCRFYIGSQLGSGLNAADTWSTVSKVGNCLGINKCEL